PVVCHTYPPAASAPSCLRLVEVSIRLRILSVAAIWYGRITNSMRSAVSTQYRVSTLRSECLAKNVCVKPTRSAIGLLVASAHQDVNSKLFDVFLTRADFCSSRCCARVVL